jgi:glycosyltransferase involved in cell wall biosynthesis
VVCSSSAATDLDDTARLFRVVRVPTGNRYVYEVKVRAALVRAFLAHSRILVAGLESYVLDAARLVPRRYILRVPGDTVWESARNYGVTSDGFDQFQAADVPPPSLVRDIAARRQRYLSLASTVVTPSRYLEGVVRRWPGVPADLRTISNGIEISDYPDRPSLPRDGRPLRILFVGRLTNWKGAETLLLAARGLTGAEITIVGDGPELPMLSGFHAQLGSELASPVTFYGRLAETAVRSKMLDHDVLVLPSNYEGMSHTLLEGCASSLVPIVSDNGGNLEVITHEENGLVVPYGRPDALRSALARLLDNDQLRLRLSAAARRRAADFPFLRTVEGYARLLEEQQT